jgi:hypothetical protein
MIQKPIRAKKSFKVILNTGEAVHTGTTTNATFYTDFRQIIMRDEDFDKPYKMTFCFRNATDSNTSILNDSPVYIAISLSNGKSIANTLTTNNTIATGLLYTMIDIQNTYQKSYQLIINSTTAPNIITLASNVGLQTGQVIQIAGTAVGGLTPGNYAVNTIAGNNITLFESPVLTTASGNMNLYYTNSIQLNKQGFLQAKYHENPPTYIDNLRNIDKINCSIYSPTTLLSPISSWICILNFEEI